MARERREFIGVRLSPQGIAYTQLVAQREKVTFSEALRRLLALGARTDMEAHLGSKNGHRPDPGPETDRAGRRGGDGESRETPPVRHGDGGSGTHLPVPDLAPAPGTGGSSLGDAIRNVYNGGLNPTRIPDDAA